MNPSFEDMWNVSNSPKSTEPNENIFASMEPYRVPLETTIGSDAQMVVAYKKAHWWNSCEASNDMEMISSKTICRKCMLHIKVCRTYGYNLKKHESEQHVNRDSSRSRAKK